MRVLATPKKQPRNQNGKIKHYMSKKRQKQEQDWLQGKIIALLQQ